MMRKIMAPVSAAIAGALFLSACSERTEDAAGATLNAAAADAEANAEAVGEKVEKAAAEAAAVVDRTAAKANQTSSSVDAETERDSGTNEALDRDRR